MALGPAGFLPHGSAEAGGLFIIHPGVVVPQDAPPVQGGLHLNFNVLRQRGGGPAAALLQVAGGDGVARTAHRAVQPQAVLGQLEEAVGHGIAGVVEPGHRAGLVLRAQVALDQVGPALVQELAVHLAEHVGINQVVRVEDHQQVIARRVVSQGLQRGLEGNGLARGGVGAVLLVHQHMGAQASCHLGGAVGAVVRDNVKIIQLGRIVHGLQIADHVADNLFLIMGGHQHQKTGFRLVLLIIPGIPLKTENCQVQLINQHHRQPDAAHNQAALHDDLKHLQGSFLLCAIFQALSMVHPPMNSLSRESGGISSSMPGSMAEK